MTCEYRHARILNAPCRFAVARAATPELSRLDVATDVPLYAAPRETSMKLVRNLGGVPRVVRLQDGVIRRICNSLQDCAV